MKSLPAIPVLVANLAEEGTHDFLRGVAVAETVVVIPLVTPPVDRSTHTLEVYSPDSTEPLILLADPMGPPTEEGFPLRLRLEQPPASRVITPVRRPTTLRPKHPTNHELSPRHARDLQTPEPPSASASSDGTNGGAARPRLQLVIENLVGKELAGGKLEIESMIGGGGVGAVYKAKHHTLNIPVAVKVLHDDIQANVDYCRRFHAEALAASRMDHPNITRVLDFGQEPDGLLYLVMQYLDGLSLRTILEDEKRLPLTRIGTLISQVCAGLAHAHARGIVHKDIKPENLVILSGKDDDGIPIEIVKVCDFGIAQGVAEDVGRFAGTPEYMSPEQCRTENLDVRSDIYSCGVLLYELATGDVPFRHDDIGVIIHQHLNVMPEPPRTRAPDAEIDVRLEKIIMKALAKDRAERFPNMRELRTALRNLLALPPPLSGQYRRFELPKNAANTHLAGAASNQAPLSERELPVAAVATESSPNVAGGGDAGVGGVGSVGSSPPRIEEGLTYNDAGGFAPEGPTAVGTVVMSIMSDPLAFIRQLVNTTDERAFALVAGSLDGLIGELAQTLQAETLWRLASALDMLTTDGPQGPGSRAASAAALLRVVRDPNTLAPIAEWALASDDPTGHRLLITAGVGGAHALYSARIRQTYVSARARFVMILRALGPAGLPIIRGGLERIALRLGTPGAPTLAEDLLLSIPRSRDERLGAIVTFYARQDNPTLVAPAMAALAHVCGERARALALGLLEHDDERICLAALGALADLCVADEHTPRHLARALDSKHRDVRIAAVRALGTAQGDAIPVASRILDVRLRGAVDIRDSEITVDLARGLLRVDRASGKRVLADIGASWPVELRQAIAEE